MKILKPYNKSINRSLDETNDDTKQVVTLQSTTSESVKVPDHIESTAFLASLILSELGRVFSPKCNHNPWFVEFYKALAALLTHNDDGKKQVIETITRKINLQKKSSSKVPVKTWQNSLSSYITKNATSKKHTSYKAFSDKQMIEALGDRISKRKALLEISLQNNIMPFYLHDKKAHATSSKNKYYVDLLKDLVNQNGNNSTEYLNSKIDTFAQEYKLTQFVKSIQKQMNEEQKALNKDNKHFNIELNIGSIIKSVWYKKLWKLPQGDSKLEPRRGQLFFHNLLKEVFDSMFPVSKGKAANQNKAKVLWELLMNCDLEAKIKERVVSKFKNILTQHLIRIGKVDYYRELLNPNNQSPITVMQSKHAITISIIEDFIRDVAGVLAFANYGLRNLLLDESHQELVTEDILINDVFNKTSLMSRGDTEHVKKQLPIFFGDECEFNHANSEELKYLASILRATLFNTRNNCYHFKKFNELKPLFCTSYYMPRTDANTAAIKKNFDQKVQTIIESDLKLIQKKIKDEITASFVLHYFSPKDVEEVFTQVNIFEAPLPLKPSFRNIYQRACDNKVNRSLVNNIEKTKHENSNSYAAHRKMWQYYYEHHAYQLLEASFANSTIEAIIEAVIKKSQDKTTKLADNDLAETNYTIFASIPISETPSLYFAQLQSILATQFPSITQESQEKKRNFVAQFIQDLLLHLMQIEAYKAQHESIFARICKSRPPLSNSDKPTSASNLTIKIKEEVLDPKASEYYPFYLMLHTTNAQQASNLLHNFNKLMAAMQDDNLNVGNTDDFKQAETLRHYLVLYNYIRGNKIGNPTQSLSAEEIARLNRFYESPQVLHKIVNAASNEKNKQNIITYKAFREISKYSFLPLLKKLYTESNLIATETDRLHYKAMQEDIITWQKARTDLHLKWAQNAKGFSDKQQKEYEELIKKIDDYNHLKHKLHGHYIQRLHNIIMDVLGKMIQSSAMWERDLHFLLLGVNCFHEEDLRKQIRDVFSNGVNINRIPKQIVPVISYLFTDNIEQSYETKKYVSHLNYFNFKDKPTSSLIDCLNRLRRLMAYDRKLKNAVAAKFCGYFKREKMIVSLKMMEDHNFKNELILQSDSIQHLKSSLKVPAYNIDFIAMVKKLLEYKK